MRRDAVAVEMSHRLRGECLVGGSSRRIDCDGSHFLAGYAGPWNGSGSWLWQGPLKESAGSCGIQARRPLAAVIAVATRRMLVWSRLPRQQARWTGMWWSARLAGIRRVLIAGPGGLDRERTTLNSRH